MILLGSQKKDVYPGGRAAPAACTGKPSLTIEENNCCKTMSQAKIGKQSDLECVILLATSLYRNRFHISGRSARGWDN
jgi:hypothetical protein